MEHCRRGFAQKWCHRHWHALQQYQIEPYTAGVQLGQLPNSCTTIEAGFAIMAHPNTITANKSDFFIIMIFKGD